MPTPREHLYSFVNLKHFEQKRKYTGEPYFQHVKAVAEMADGIANFGYEIGLCHDLLEDTDCKRHELYDALMRFGYGIGNSCFICDGVDDLTDVYTHEDYPNYNRAKRKQFEAERLWTISPDNQTVKYCDFIDNTKSIVQHDPGFAKVYLAEKAYILKGMNKGDKHLYKQACDLK